MQHKQDFNMDYAAVYIISLSIKLKLIVGMP